MTESDPVAGAWVGGSTVATLFRERARIDADRPAVIEGDMVRSFAQVQARGERLSGALAARGIGRGDRVAMLARNCAEYVEVELACGALGAITACQNWRLADPELDHCLRLVQPALIIAQPEYADRLTALGLEVPVLTTGAAYEAALAAADPVGPDPAVDPEDGFVILYTSGTTGLPKGALISHRAMVARAMVIGADLGVPAQDAFVAWPPFFHMASTDTGMGALLRGGPVIVVDGYQPDVLIDLLQRHRMGHFIVIPGMIEDFITHLKAARPDIVGIHCIGAMADLVPPHQIAEITTLLNAPYVNTFGSTETGLPPATGDFVPVGHVPTDLAKRQSSFCEVRLVDADGVEVPDGVPGECAIRGPTVFSGYWRAPETNAKDFRGGWFHLGDAFVRTPEGRFAFKDRVKYMIKSGGENIYPAEIERVLMADPRVDDACVVRRMDARWGEVPVAAVAVNDPALTAEDLLARCRAELAGYKMPKEIRFVAFDALPRSTTGKIQRHEVEPWFTQEAATRAS